MDKVVVIGGSGFLGSHAADELTRRGFKVLVFDNVESRWIQENQEMLEMLHKEQAIFVYVYYKLDVDGKRVYDRQTMREEFEENMETLISLNKQRENGGI